MTKAEASTQVITFDHEGKTYQLPVRSALKAGMLRRHRGKAPQDYMFSLLEDATDPETLAALDEKDIDEFDAILGRWSDHVFGTDPGNS